MNLSIDYHAHILPGCDHGCDAVSTSLKQLEMAKHAGVKVVCATPHFYPEKESIDAFLCRRADAYSKLIPNLTEDLPEIQLGAEVLICDSMERMAGLEKLCRSGTNELLLEMPFYAWTDSIWDTLYHLCDREDLQTVIAHADRYPVKYIEQLIAEEVPLQLNVECLTRPLRRGRYLKWILQGAVWYLGSDIHMLGGAYQDWEKSVKLLRKQS